MTLWHYDGAISKNNSGVERYYNELESKNQKKKLISAPWKMGDSVITKEEQQRLDGLKVSRVIAKASSRRVARKLLFRISLRRL